MKTNYTRVKAHNPKVKTNYTKLKTHYAKVKTIYTDYTIVKTRFAWQAQILARAVALLPPGGKVVFSTCSLNPVEDEAVVAFALATAPHPVATPPFVRFCVKIGPVGQLHDTHQTA